MAEALLSASIIRPNIGAYVCYAIAAEPPSMSDSIGPAICGQGNRTTIKYAPAETRKKQDQTCPCGFQAPIHLTLQALKQAGESGQQQPLCSPSRLPLSAAPELFCF